MEVPMKDKRHFLIAKTGAGQRGGLRTLPEILLGTVNCFCCLLDQNPQQRVGRRFKLPSILIIHFFKDAPETLRIVVKE